MGGRRSASRTAGGGGTSSVAIARTVATGTGRPAPRCGTPDRWLWAQWHTCTSCVAGASPGGLWPLSEGSDTWTTRVSPSPSCNSAMRDSIGAARMLTAQRSESETRKRDHTLSMSTQGGPK